MQRRLLSALAALALAVQSGGALAAFGIEPHACCCVARGMTGEHQCDCPECARRRCQSSGLPSIGGCDSDSGPLAFATAASEVLPPAASIDGPAPRLAAPLPRVPLPPREPARDVPTPPPLA